MPDPRRLLRSIDPPGREAVTLRNAFRAGSVALFFVLMGALILVSLTADIVLAAILAAAVLSQMLWVILPKERIQARARALWTGEAGENAYEEIEDRGGGLL